MPDDTCHIEHCHNIEEKYGLCRTHYGRWWRYSDPYYVDDGYYQAHKRVRLVRGLPDAHECAGCGVKQASEWAYDHRDEHEEFGSNGSPYSVDPGRYVPLCVQCHRRFDRLRAQVKAAIAVGRVG